MRAPDPRLYTCHHPAQTRIGRWVAITPTAQDQAHGKGSCTQQGAGEEDACTLPAGTARCRYKIGLAAGRQGQTRERPGRRPMKGVTHLRVLRVMPVKFGRVCGCVVTSHERRVRSSPWYFDYRPRSLPTKKSTSARPKGAPKMESDKTMPSYGHAASVRPCVDHPPASSSVPAPF